MNSAFVWSLGAPRTNILGIVLRNGLGLCLIGVAGGIGMFLLATRFFPVLPLGTRGADPLTFAIVVALLLMVVLLASCLPANRAKKIDPIKALRE
jgi:putative ABC transport system permease protein